MKKILLTGSTGFIGRNIFNSFLFKKYKIFMPRHSELDVLKPINEYVKKNEIDYFRGSETDVLDQRPKSIRRMDLSGSIYKCLKSNIKFRINVGEL